MLSCVSPHFVELLKKLFGTIHDTTMESVRNLQAYPVLRMKCSASQDSDLAHQRVSVDGDFISYAPDDDERVGVYIAGYILTPEACYFETEIVDTGVDCSISIGLCSKDAPLDMHIGCSVDSVGLLLDDGRLYRDGSRGAHICIRCECGDRIGCGVKFEHMTKSSSITSRSAASVPVYFVRNGKEIGTTIVGIPLGGLHPAIGMHSIGEEVRLFLGLNWIPEEDSLMSVDTNEEDWYRLNDIRLNGQILEYTGRGKSIIDVGLAQAKSPLDTTVHYFEIEIIDPGESCYIAIGLTRRDYPKHRHPGWNKGSIGYHADDGKIFIGSGVGDPFGPRCHKGDRMGCGILFPRDYVCQYDSGGGSGDVSPSSPNEVDDLLELSLEASDSEDEEWWNNQCAIECNSKVKVFFTRNGKTVGVRQVRIPKGGFYPTIGMLSVQEKVRVDLRPLTG